MRWLLRVLATLAWGFIGLAGSVVFLNGISGVFVGLQHVSPGDPELEHIASVWTGVAFGVCGIMLVLGLFGRLPGTRRRREPYAPTSTPGYIAGPLATAPALAGAAPRLGTGVTMRISYQNKFWDLVAFQFYMAIRSPLTLIIWGIVLINVCWTAFAGSKDQSVPVRILTTAMAGVLVVIIFFAVYGLICVTIFISRKNRNFLTQHILTFTEDSLVEETQYNRSETKWAGVVKVARTLNYLFIYVTQHSAHVIPRRAVSDPDWDMIYEFCKRKATENKPAPRVP